MPRIPVLYFIQNSLYTIVAIMRNIFWIFIEILKVLKSRHNQMTQAKKSTIRSHNLNPIQHNIRRVKTIQNRLRIVIIFAKRVLVHIMVNTYKMIQLFCVEWMPFVLSRNYHHFFVWRYSQFLSLLISFAATTFNSRTYISPAIFATSLDLNDRRNDKHWDFYWFPGIQ